MDEDEDLDFWVCFYFIDRTWQMTKMTEEIGWVDVESGNEMTQRKRASAWNNEMSPPKIHIPSDMVPACL